jgi:hypothetical protein
MSQDMSNMMMGDMAENPPSPEELKVRSPAVLLLLSLIFFLAAFVLGIVRTVVNLSKVSGRQYFTWINSPLCVPTGFAYFQRIPY